MGLSISAITLLLFILEKNWGHEVSIKFTDVLKNCLKKLTGPQSYEDPNFNKTG